MWVTSMTMSQPQFTGSGGKCRLDRSPFPGMDPYLELHWRDVHLALVVYYNADPISQFSLPDARWADELLRAAGFRGDGEGGQR
jgi:hypothetical protein